MKEISKAEFIRRITNGKSYFIGISPELDVSEIEAVRRNLKTSHYNARTCIAKANQHLVFSNDSHLYLASKGNVDIRCYATEDNILIVVQTWHEIDCEFCRVSNQMMKCLYYAMV